MTDLDRAIRDRVANVLDPGACAHAVTAALDLCDRISVGLEGAPSAIGRAFADEFRVVIADALGVDRG